MTFVEQLIRKRKEGREWMLITLIWSGAIVLAFVAMLLIMLLAKTTGGVLTITHLMLWLMAVGGLTWLAVWLTKTQYIEFEYSVYEGELDIDQITGKRRRKRIVQVPARKIDAILPCTPAELTRPIDREVVAAPSRAEATWCVNYHSKKNGNTRVLIQPNNRTMNALYEGLTVPMQRELQQKCREAGVEITWL